MHKRWAKPAASLPELIDDIKFRVSKACKAPPPTPWLPTEGADDYKWVANFVSHACRRLTMLPTKSTQKQLQAFSNTSNLSKSIIALALMDGKVRRSGVLNSPWMLPAVRPSLMYRNRRPFPMGCSAISTCTLARGSMLSRRRVCGYKTGQNNRQKFTN